MFLKKVQQILETINESIWSSCLAHNAVRWNNAKWTNQFILLSVPKVVLSPNFERTRLNERPRIEHFLINGAKLHLRTRYGSPQKRLWGNWNPKIKWGQILYNYRHMLTRNYGGNNYPTKQQNLLTEVSIWMPFPPPKRKLWRNPFPCTWWTRAWWTSLFNWGHSWSKTRQTVAWNNPAIIQQSFILSHSSICRQRDFIKRYRFLHIVQSYIGINTIRIWDMTTRTAG